MKEIIEIKKNFEMGFITPHEFLTHLLDVLSVVGAYGELQDTINEVLAPLANFIKDEIINAPSLEKKQIKDFLKKEA